MSRPPLPADEALSALALYVRLDGRRAEVVCSLAEVSGIEKPEAIRRMIDFFILHNGAVIGAARVLEAVNAK